MPYLPKVKNDIFISYRHASNETHDRWIDSFCQELQARLAELIGEVTIWRDKAKLVAGEQWRVEIAEAIDSTAIFLAIISRTYFDSDVCRKELNHFLGRIKSASQQVHGPIVPVFKQPPKPDQDLPRELAEIHRHEFFKWDPLGSHHFREFSPAKGDESFLFWETLERLAQDLMDTLEKIRGIDTPPAGTIYLSRVGPELHDVREKLRSDLRQHGYQVLPDREYFWNSSEIKEKITNTISTAELCIHLIAKTASIEAETSERARLQLQLATEIMARRGKPPPLVWLQPSDTIDASARPLIDYVEQDLANLGVEFIEDSLEEFKTQIYAKLPSRLPIQPSAPSSGDVAMIVEESDIAATGEINTFLVNELHLNPKRIVFLGCTVRDFTSLHKTLSSCGKCLIYWGKQSEEWLCEVLAHEALTAHIDSRRLGVYAAAPETAEKATFLTTKARTISGTTGTSKDELRSFLLSEEIGS
jgi:TIR domain